MKRCGWIYYLLLVLLTYSCSQISESERFIDVEPATVKRAVLIEEFTGQRCVNCPNAATEIARIQQSYGENVIAVAIHSGPLAVFSRDQVTGLRTELGDTYYNYWGVEEEPSALINRKGGVVRLNQWQAFVYDELQAGTSLTLGMDCQLTEGGEILIAVRAETLEVVQGKLQLWLVENGVEAPQMMPDGTLNLTYEHHHVLRSSVNGVWGDVVDWKAGEVNVVRYTVTPQAEWDVKRLFVVAFVYDGTGVLQVVQRKVS